MLVTINCIKCGYVLPNPEILTESFSEVKCSCCNTFLKGFKDVRFNKTTDSDMGTKPEVKDYSRQLATKRQEDGNRSDNAWDFDRWELGIRPKHLGNLK